MNYKKKVLQLIEAGALRADNEQIAVIKSETRQQIERLQANRVNESFEQRLKTDEQVNQLKEEVMFYMTILEGSPVVNNND
jgi:hypothetical protein